MTPAAQRWFLTITCLMALALAAVGILSFLHVIF